MTQTVEHKNLKNFLMLGLHINKLNFQQAINLFFDPQAKENLTRKMNEGKGKRDLILL